MRYQETREFEDLYNELVVKYLSGGVELADEYMANKGYIEEFRKEMLVFVRWHVDKGVRLEEITEARRYLSEFDWAD